MSDAGKQDGHGEDAETFLDKVGNAFNDLVEVKVVTAVGDLPVTIDTVGDSTTTTLGKTTLAQGAIVTVVKLLDGDVTTVVPEALVGNAEVRAMHAAQVAASLDVIPNHLKTLVELAEGLVDRLKG
jgi:hypothetical protein